MSWHDNAACKGMDTQVFYQHEEGHPSPVKDEVREYVLNICGSCTVREACLDDALNDDDQHGIRGGMTAPQRRQIKVTPTKHLSPCGTRAAATRHRRHREPLDDACKEAERAQSRERNAKRAARREAA